MTDLRPKMTCTEREFVDNDMHYRPVGQLIYDPLKPSSKSPHKLAPRIRSSPRRRPTADQEFRYVTDETSQAQRLAVAVADFLLAHDKAACGLGISVFRVGIGSAIMKMTVRSDMLNAFYIFHGGVGRARADRACAGASTARAQRARES